MSELDWPTDTQCVVCTGKFQVDFCKQPVVGERGGWRMCRLHFDLFCPEAHHDSRPE